VTTIAENIERLSDRLQRLERQYGRSAGSVKLLAVSKRHPVESIIAANEAGIQDFGENYLQEALDKIQRLSSIRVNWHFIGPIQSNKTKAIAENFQWVHSIDRLKIAQRLNDQREHSQSKLNICVQIKLSQETSKSGVELGEAEALCDSVEALPNLELRGVMAIPAVLQDLESQRLAFRALAQEYSRLKPRYAQFDTLSMGMSNDFEAAVAEGSTLIRIGTSLFGPRS
jgi:pyridoxal phosphate enzyme (YggS family)